MAKYTVIAYPDEDGYPRKTAVIEAADKEEAWRKAFKMFPEYHEIGVWDGEDES